MARKMPVRTIPPPKPKNADREPIYVSFSSQITLVRRIAILEILVAIIILLSQSVAIASSYTFATRSLTGIWTSWFFLGSAAVCLFWSSRCTFNGLLAVLVLQIISATMSVPLLTACCLLFGVYPFKWSVPEGTGGSIIAESIGMLTTNLVMVVLSIVEMGLSGYNAYNCYFLAYGEAKEDVYSEKPGNENCATNPSKQTTSNQQRPSRKPTINSKAETNPLKSRSKTNWDYSNQGQNEGEDDGVDDKDVEDENYDSYEADNFDDDTGEDVFDGHGNDGSTKAPGKGIQKRPYTDGAQMIHYDDPAMPQPPPDMTIGAYDLLVIKYCGITGVILAFLIFCAQTAMLALVSEPGVNIGIGIWGALYYCGTGIITVYNGLKPTAQSPMAIFTLQTMQFILSIPLVGISYYILGNFASCIQHDPIVYCPPGYTAGISVMVLGGGMALAGTVQGLTSLILMLITSQAVCGIRCMTSSATVYPTL